MKMSDGVEWGIHCASVLSQIDAGATLPGKALAEFHGVSESYLLKHLKALTAAGIFESVPGPHGGYRLARAAAAITLLDIVLAVDGSEPAFRCSEIRQRGPAALPAKFYRTPCGINKAMLRAERAWRAELKAVTVADMVKDYACSAETRSQELAKAWAEQNQRRSAS